MMRIRRLLPLIGLLIFGYILTTLDFKSIVYLFSQIPVFYVILSFACIVPILIMTLVEWQLLLRIHRIHMSLSDSLRNILIGYFYGFITPGGLGAYTRTIYMKECTSASMQQCTANIILLNAIDYVSLLVMGLVGSVFLGIHFAEFSSYFIPIFTLLIFSGIGLYLFFMKKDFVERIFTRILSSSWMNKKNVGSGTTTVSFYTDFPRIRALWAPFSLAIAGWMIRYVLFYLIGILFGIMIPWYYVVLFGILGDIIGSLPITVYGLGTREATLIGLFSVFQVSENAVVSLSLFWFVLVWMFPSVLGALIIIGADMRKHRVNGSIS